jgi:RecB family exonuclease
MVSEAGASDAAVIVPNLAAARLAAAGRALDRRILFVSRGELYDEAHARLPGAPRRLTAFEREALAQAAAVDAARAVPDLTFRVRPGLVSEILRFYDQLRRQSQTVRRFAELIEQALGADAGADRGSERMRRQTRFLERTFSGYERRVQASGGCDEHTLRARLVAEPIDPPVGRVIVTVGDWIADPDGLFVADFGLLTRMPGVEAIDVVCTEALLESGFHQRLHDWLPGLEEADGRAIAGDLPRARPALIVPADAAPEQTWFVRRDREEELAAVAHAHDDGGRPGSAPATVGIVYKHPLPYLYLAPATLGAAGVPYQTADALPLAAEPTAAAVDLVLDAVETSFSRDSLVALLRSPHFCLGDIGAGASREAISAFDRALSEKRYLGDLGRLETLAAAWQEEHAVPALQTALAIARELAPLAEPARASVSLGRLQTFLSRHWTPLDLFDPFMPRETRARAAVADILGRLAAAHAAHHDPEWTMADLSGAVRRWIQEKTFAADEEEGTGVHLVDDRAARYGDFAHLAIVGLIENDWPERPMRNIFYPPALLRALGWPSEKDRRAAADARLLDLLASASRDVTLSTVTLEDEALVTPSTQLDEIPRARLSAIPEEKRDRRPMFPDDALAMMPPALDRLLEPALDWAQMRLSRPLGDLPAFHGAAGPHPPRAWSVSAVETYVECPFKFFARHVLALDEEPEDEEVMDPRRQGRLVHTVFEQFFKAWQDAGHGAITPANLDAARTMFEEVVDRELEALPQAEAGLERTRLLGSPAASGLGEAVFRMEAERPVGVVERLLEYPLKGDLTLTTSAGPRVIALRGKADRIDLLADGTFRLIDYKLGWPPDRTRALQLPVYALFAEQRLRDHSGRTFTLGEAAYLAFKGPKRVVPLFTSPAQRAEVLARAQDRLSDAIDAIGRGEFPPRPDDVYRCEMCSFASVCRKDYVAS